MTDSVENYNFHGSEIAIIGMSGRFPGAKNVDEFWQNLKNGSCSISSFTKEELLAAGVDAKLLNNPNYVKVGGILADAEFFDAEFFGFNPKEAEVTDIQHRVFLECAWEALENSGYSSENYSGLIGVYAGSNLNGYLLHIYSHPEILNSVNSQQITIGSDKDYLTTKVSYKLNLTGPSYTIQTACSTSLVAVHLACQSLLSGECDLALAGGVAINAKRKQGYLYKEGGVNSPDGYCRAFDAKAQGTVGGEGVGIVVLKRLEDALNDKDTIHAIIKGSAINNDGANKVSYTAPRIEGQAKVIRTAQIVAEVEPETITYIEAHGTGTSLGDPIEIAALTQAFPASTEKKEFCAVASVKTNIGHLDAAAGIAGLIKTVLALKHKQIPPSLHFEKPNPHIDFNNSPFYVNTVLKDWEVNGIPRRAGVSSFGIGGTNAHVILEEAPPVETVTSARNWQLLILSAKTPTALETATANLAIHLQQNPHLNLNDVAYTLQIGRKIFDYRRLLVCQNSEQAVQLLTSKKGVLTHHQKSCKPSVVFMFPGQGAQYVNMAAELYQTESVFANHINRCAELLKPHLGLDIREVIYLTDSKVVSRLNETALTQPALFVIEYALAQLWMSWGVHPEAMIGNSIGEYVAATLADVFSLSDALMLVAHRGKLMQQLPKGAMLSVAIPASNVKNLLGDGLSLAVNNAPSACVVAGTNSAIAELQAKLQARGINCRLLHTSHAFHSSMMEAIINPFIELLAKVTFNPPQIPFISNVTGTWITTEQVTDPHYWAKHLRQTVLFNEGIIELIKQPQRILLEVGPGRTLSSLVKQHQNQEIVTLTSVSHPQETQSDVAFILTTLGRLWLLGVKINWSGFYGQEQRFHIPLPTYPFERKPYLISLNKQTGIPVNNEEKLDISKWFYTPTWKQSLPVIISQLGTKNSCYLVFADDCQIGSAIVKQLELENQNPISVLVGEQFAKIGTNAYTINPQNPEDYHALIVDLRYQNLIPDCIFHCWSITPNANLKKGSEFFNRCQELGFYSLLFLTQALDKQLINQPLKLITVTNNLHDVTGNEKLAPEKSTILAASQVIPQEYINISCQNIDILISDSDNQIDARIIDKLLAEITSNSTDLIVAYRGHHRWVKTFESVNIAEAENKISPLRQEGIYLITGGLGGVGLVVAEYLAKTVKAKLILISRSGLPDKNLWLQWLDNHDQEDSISCKIRQLQALEKLGAEVLVISADVADEGQMRQAIAQATQHFGKINGVIHCAGDLQKSIFQPIQATTINQCQKHFQAKVNGTYVLTKLFQNHQLDFCIFTSSLAAILGGLNFAAYSAANIFIDAFVHQQNQISNVTWSSINWDGWQFSPTTETTNSITTTEGQEAFDTIFKLNHIPQILVSTTDLNLRIYKWLELQNIKSQSTQENNSLGKYSRPNLLNAYIQPQTEIEQIITNIWQQILGINQIGIHDNFFELGGHSLLATQLIAHLRQKLQIEIPLQQIFASSTIAEQAAEIESIKSQISNLKIDTITKINRENAPDISVAIDKFTDAEIDLLLKQLATLNYVQL
ncbi:SDR family NAD(P)-dependent oxidoreductase [Anabaena sp. UHCC 0253]|uniref:type I polyketide synthase n=1 Tax=Anabaena sp. UHCC 0253 TaxID=2590019 RepID=UPI0014472966|nr:type I polyketide synthase [Anabaena sp. UHCC 0253]MTJ53555.1 SDR family NAD(P)-dependent oxidoreductase [Anabaena sp. UHCC 0253]